MKKISILALAAFSLLGLPLFANDEPAEKEPVATTTEETTSETPTSDSNQLSANEEEVTKSNFLVTKEGEQTPAEDERIA